MHGITYTEEHEAFVRDHIKTHNYKKLTELFNARFSLSISTTAMKGNFKRWKLKTGRDTRFKKNCVPFNKGTVGLMKANKGSFQKNHFNENTAPIGAERIKTNGYTFVKTAMPNTWELKHRLIYGPVPDGFVVIFKDGDKTNFTLENLEAISRNEIFNLNKNGYSTAPEEIRPLIRVVAKIETAIQKK